MSKLKALPLPLIINTAISNPDSLLDNKKFGRLCIIGKSDNGRGTPFGIYTSLAGVMADYGVEAGEYLQAQRFFDQVENGKILITTAEYASIIRPTKIEPIPDPEPVEPDDEDFDSEYISVGYEPLAPNPVYPIPPDPEPEPIEYSHVINSIEHELFVDANVDLYINDVIANVGDEFVIGDTLTVKGDGYTVVSVRYGNGIYEKDFTITDGVAKAVMNTWNTGDLLDTRMTNKLLSEIDFYFVSSLKIAEPEPEPICLATYANFDYADMEVLGGAQELSFWTIAVVNGVEHRVHWSSMNRDVFVNFVNENGAGLTANMLFASMMYELSKANPVVGDFITTHTNLLASSFDYGKRLSGIDSTNKDDLKDTIEYIGGQASGFRTEPTVITFKDLTAGELAGKNAGSIRAINMMSLFNRAKDFLLKSCIAFNYNKQVMPMSNVLNFSTFNAALDDGGYDESLTTYKELPIGLYINTPYYVETGTKPAMPSWRLTRNGEVIADSDGFKVDDVRVVLDSEIVLDDRQNNYASSIFELVIFLGKGDKNTNDYKLIFDDNAENLSIYIENKGDGTVGDGESFVDIKNFCPAISHYEFMMDRSASTTKLIVPDNLPAHVKDLDYMFAGVPEFDQDVSLWDTSNIISMNYTFAGCWKFNQPLGRWNVSNVKSMVSMLCKGYSLFRRNLNSWCVTNITPEMGLEFIRDTNYDPSTLNNIASAAPLWGTCPGVITIPGKNTIPNPDTNLRFSKVIINTAMAGGFLSSKFKVDVKFENGSWLPTVNGDYSQNLTDMDVPALIVTDNGVDGIVFETDYDNEIITVKITASNEQKALSNEFLLGDGLYQSDTGQFAFNLSNMPDVPFDDLYPGEDFTDSNRADTVWDVPPVEMSYSEVAINNIETVKSLTSKYKIEVLFEAYEGEREVVNGPYNTFYTHNLHEHEPNQIGFAVDSTTGNITITPKYLDIPMVVRLTPNPSKPRTSNDYVIGDGNYDTATGAFTFRLDSSSN